MKTVVSLLLGIFGGMVGYFVADSFGALVGFLAFFWLFRDFILK